MERGRSLVTGLAAAVTAYFALSLLARDVVPPLVRVGLLGNLICVLSIAMTLRHARRHRAGRTCSVPICLGICAFVGGGNLSLLVPGTDAGLMAALVAVLDLAVCPLLLVGMLAALRQHLRRARLLVVVDGISIAVSAAAVVVCVTEPLVARLWTGSTRDVVSLGLVFGDGILITVSVASVAVVGLAQARNFVVWSVGMLVFAVGDITYASLLASDHYVSGTWVDGLWLAGLALTAVGATMRADVQPRTVPPMRTLGVGLVAALAAVVVLVLGPAWTQNPAPTVLALLSLAGVVVRFGVAFFQLRELAEVRELALTDELTGSANRRALYRRLDALLEAAGEDGATILQRGGRGAGRGSGRAGGSASVFTLALIDLDRFKEVNDSLGHGAGDELLQLVAGRFEETLAGTGTSSLLARLGGDEFAVILDDVDTPSAALAMGELLLRSLAEPVTVASTALHVRASVGVAIAPEHGRSRGDLLFAADSAMYTAKAAGRSLCLFTPTAAADGRRDRLAVVEDLYRAFERDELTAVFQPIRSLSGRLVAAEALVRWDHPVRGRLGPQDFLDLAEEHKLTQPLTARVLDVALGHLSRWRTKHPALTVSVNISASELGDETVVATVAEALIRHQLPASALTVEVTETAMMRDPALARTVLHALADLGVDLAVDDYGTGYSSLAYLLDLPIDEIKLDRAFVADLLTRARSIEIVRSTVDLARALELRMVAEGVETQAQLDTLQSLGCDRVQGWHLGRPVAADAFEVLLGSPVGQPSP